MESAAAAAWASPDAAKQARDKDAQNNTQKRNLTGFSSKGDKDSISSTESRDPSEETLVEERKRGF